MLFIINPTAARGRAMREWVKARRELVARGVKFSEHLTKYPGEAVEVARRALRSGEECVVVVGGDGTLNEVVNGYFDEVGQVINSAAAIGLLPCGTGSDFRRSLGLMTCAHALRALNQRQTRWLDAARVELRDKAGVAISRHLINVATFGLGGEAAALVNGWRETWPRWIGGRVRFVAAAVRALKQYRNRAVRVRLDGERELGLDSNFLVVANGCYAGGGMMLAPHAELDDGLLDVVLTDGATRWELVRELPGIRRGAHLGHPKVSTVRGREIEIASDRPLAVEVDGEPAGYTPARLTVLPAAVRFVVRS
jgi:YegS/Rv2252/BmrU family lipid kinase